MSWSDYSSINVSVIASHKDVLDSRIHGANMGPTWVLSAPDGPHVGPMSLAIRGVAVQAKLADNKRCCIEVELRNMIHSPLFRVRSWNHAVKRWMSCFVRTSIIWDGFPLMRKMNHNNGKSYPNLLVFTGVSWSRLLPSLHIYLVDLIRVLSLYLQLLFFFLQNERFGMACFKLRTPNAYMYWFNMAQACYTIRIVFFIKICMYANIEKYSGFCYVDIWFHNIIFMTAGNVQVDEQIELLLPNALYTCRPTCFILLSSERRQLKSTCIILSKITNYSG